MYAKNELPLPPKSRPYLHHIAKYQQNHQSVIKVLQKYQHLAQHLVSVNKSLREAYKTEPSFRNFTFPKAVPPYSTFGSYPHMNNVNNVIKSQITAPSPPRRDSTQVIFQRLEVLDDDYATQPVEEVFTKTVVKRNFANVQTIMPPKAQKYRNENISNFSAKNVVLPDIQVLIKPKPPVKRSHNMSKHSENVQNISQVKAKWKPSQVPVLEEKEDKVQVRNKKHAHPVIDAKRVDLSKANTTEVPRQIQPKQKNYAPPVNKPNPNKNSRSSNTTTKSANAQKGNILEILKPKPKDEKEKNLKYSQSSNGTTKSANAQKGNIPEIPKPKDEKGKDLKYSQGSNVTTKSGNAQKGNIPEVPKLKEGKDLKYSQSSNGTTKSANAQKGNIPDVPKPREEKDLKNLQSSNSTTKSANAQKGNILEVLKLREEKDWKNLLSSYGTSKSGNNQKGNIPEVTKPKEETDLKNLQTGNKKSEYCNPIAKSEVKNVPKVNEHIPEVPKPKEEKGKDLKNSQTGNKQFQNCNFTAKPEVKNVLKGNEHIPEVPKPKEEKAKDLKNSQTGNKQFQNCNFTAKLEVKNVPKVNEHIPEVPKPKEEKGTDLKNSQTGNKQFQNSNLTAKPEVKNVPKVNEHISEVPKPKEEKDLKNSQTGNKQSQNCNLTAKPEVKNLTVPQVPKINEQKASKSTAEEHTVKKLPQSAPQKETETETVDSKDQNRIKNVVQPKNKPQQQIQKTQKEAETENVDSKDQDKAKNVVQPKNKPQQQIQKTQKNNAPATEKKNKGKNTGSDSTQMSEKNHQLTEIFKRNKSNGTKNASSEPDSLDFHRVTEELTTIIKDFQKQILDVKTIKSPMEEVPSAMIQPKVKKFFKNVSSNASNVAPTNKDQTNNNKKPSNHTNETSRHPSSTSDNDQKQRSSTTCGSRNALAGGNSSLSNHNNVLKQSSLKSFTKGAIVKVGDVRRYRSLTHHGASRSSLSVDPLKHLKDDVQKAIKDRRTFTVVGNARAIRNALVKRGWVEKYHHSYKNHLSDELKKYMNYTVGELLPLIRNRQLNETLQNVIRSKLLGNYQVDFYWGYGVEPFKANSDKIKLTLINRLKREIFSYTNKEGLCEANKTSYWFQKSNLSKLNHPRTYSLGKNGEVRDFIEDFQKTAAMSLLKWVVKIDETKECKLLSSTGKVPLEVFDFAVNECCKLIKKGRHEDIDTQIVEATDHEWNQFLEYFYKLLHYNNHFKDEGKETEESLVRKSNYALNNLRQFNQFVDMDGMMNMWILKPIYSNQGRGIHMCRTLKYVLKVIQTHSQTRYVIQKYIERPLLIYNTKFDIRQWFLISSCCPLTIWMYRQCYLRFSSQTYNLRKLHESVHLTNNSVQHKYKNTSLDAALPSYNMWDSTEFEKYLSDIGYPNAFNEITYPGMKQCIIASILIHQEKMVVRKNCFELYGADFMLTEDFQPWLIEINCGPAMQGSTPVTARMCPQVMEDVIKVVVDNARNSKASTGHFEMIYRQESTKMPKSGSLGLRGAPLKKSYFCNNPQEEIDKSITYSDTIHAIDSTQDTLKHFGENIKRTLNSLLALIQKEKKKRGLPEMRDREIAV